MKRLAIKFGGTSVGTIEKIKKVADIIKKRHSEGNEIIVIVSAMSGVTNELIKKSNLIILPCYDTVLYESLFFNIPTEYFDSLLPVIISSNLILYEAQPFLIPLPD